MTKTLKKEKTHDESIGCCICDGQSHISHSGFLLCNLHDTEANAWCEEQRRNGLHVNIDRWIFRARGIYAISLRLPKFLLDQLTVMAGKLGISRNAFILSILEREFSKK